ncbi:diphosphomevalonate decarboxylase [Arenibacter sp. M-2]|uniref:diphosphomevalonate/mevalonate 3,5-bisphosphate decarboxylase family protein n=1 Tax=unclassified Arenibacter TaxID=2615047 RepID=UPI000D764DEF|nr:MULTISPECIES: diphosphomevalonate decarboxylase [unclassified Arenibacter]MDL5510916.1 diphosphomevalonate decarboxylase [Arenibacter sp. M-2]PXX31660.1 diphosphomevalonate decarboxylase [Arenibacter sp. ARW7G5Y1]|tara:strand:+ start:52369 stop:53451 length:1083 start_codon:yes stop_codon:yes gene_type:complete
MTDKDFIPSSYTTDKMEGKVTYKSPSNIALVKYWGKKEHQIPANPSISFTLDTCATTTTITYKKLKNKALDFSFDLFFDGKPKEDFKPKINTFLKRTEPYLPFLKAYHFTIETSNSFPHSSGIASSASGMSALALCLIQLERELNPTMNPDFFKKKASFIARLGSGSACRSIEGDLMQWGAHKDTLDSTDLYAIKYPYKVHPIFKNYQDTILLVDKGSKQVSSSLGHNLMHDHPFAEQRFDQAHKNLSKLKRIFEEGNLLEFIKIVESEALTLHAMMMTSMPYFMLMKPNTLEIINKIWTFRESSKTHLCFTLDAGANVHVLYPESEKEEVYQFINNELVVYCENGQYICDQIGKGARKL